MTNFLLQTDSSSYSSKTFNRASALAISCLMQTFSEAISAALLSSRNSDSATNSARRAFSSAARSRADKSDFRDHLEVFELDDATDELDDFRALTFLSPLNFKTQRFCYHLNS